MDLNFYWIIPYIHLNIFLFIAGQGVPPGVNPQHYGQHQHMPQGQQPQMHQQQMHMQQHQMPMQQVPMQQQQMPMQQQQMPMQQQQMPMQQQVPMQQVPMQHQQPQQQVHMQQQQHPQQVQHHPPPQHQQQHPQGHDHAHGGQPQVLNVANLEHEKQHIAEHMSVPIDTSKMTEQELQFHYFKMHDADNNNKLDGCELIKSLIHWHEQGHSEPGKPQNPEKLFTDEELQSLIDPILSMDDTNNDGFIDYPEFIRAQQKAAAGHPPPPQPASHRKK